jgi:hypothetical protein
MDRMAKIREASERIEALLKGRSELGDVEFSDVLANQIDSVRISLDEVGNSGALASGAFSTQPAAAKYRENLVALRGLVEKSIPLVLQRMQEIDAARMRLDGASVLMRSYANNS